MFLQRIGGKEDAHMLEQDEQRDELREKIGEKPSEPKFLITVKGLGYRLNRLQV